MDSFKRNIIITGGAGFIGSHVVRLFVNKYPEYRIINLDKLTYAGNLANLKDIEDKPNYIFVKADICDFGTIQELLVRYQVDGIIHLAAESHVDRSIKDPFTFAKTVEYPCIFPEILPFFTVTTFLFEDVQTTFLLVPFTFNIYDFPLSIVTFFLLSSGFSTLTLHFKIVPFIFA